MKINGSNILVGLQNFLNFHIGNVTFLLAEWLECSTADQ